jgi:hypothetical protein
MGSDLIDVVEALLVGLEASVSKTVGRRRQRYCSKYEPTECVYVGYRFICTREPYHAGPHIGVRTIPVCAAIWDETGYLFDNRQAILLGEEQHGS